MSDETRTDKSVADSEASSARSRRGFLGRAGNWTAALAAFGAAFGSLRFLKAGALPEPSDVFRVGKPEEYEAGAARLFRGRHVLVRAEDQGLMAILLVCTHLGCVVRQDPRGFRCSCHGSVFDGQGRALKGPAPRPLKWLAVSRAPDGSLTVDLAREVEPGTFYNLQGGNG